MGNMDNFASMLKYLREREGLSQRELASKLQMSASTIGMYESGKRHPKFEDEETIADFFNVSLNVLRGRAVDENIPEMDARTRRLLEYFRLASPEVQKAVETLLKSSLPDS